MARTYTNADQITGAGNVAQPHHLYQNQLVPLPYVQFHSGGAAGSLISSPRDMAAWLRFQVNRGRVGKTQLVDETILEETRTPQVLIPRLAEEKKRLPRQHFDAYGLGWRLADYGGRLLASHGGGVDGMQSLTALLPEEQLGFAILTNAIPHYLTSALYLSIVDHVLGFADRDWRAEYLEVMRKEQARADENRQKLEAARLKGTRPSLDAAYTVTTTEPPSTARYSQQNHGSSPPTRRKPPGNVWEHCRGTDIFCAWSYSYSMMTLSPSLWLSD